MKISNVPVDLIKILFLFSQNGENVQRFRSLVPILIFILDCTGVLAVTEAGVLPVTNAGVILMLQ
jgi:hypothetical protein